MFQKIKDTKTLRNNRVVDLPSIPGGITVTPFTYPFDVSTFKTTSALSVSEPAGIEIDKLGKNIYISSLNYSYIYKIDICANTISTISGINNSIGFSDGSVGTSKLKYPGDIVLDPTDTYLYVCDQGNNAIRKINVNSNYTSTLIININSPCGMCINSLGTTLYVTSRYSHVIYKITDLNGTPVKSIIAGIIGTAPDPAVNGQLGNSTFNEPIHVAVDNTETYLYVLDYRNRMIRKIEINNNYNVTTLSGVKTMYGNTNGNSNVATFYQFTQCVLDSTNNFLYISDMGNYNIRKMNTSTGSTETIAGSLTTPRGTSGNVNGTSNTALFGQLYCITFDSKFENLYVVDAGNSAIRKIKLATSTTIIGSSYKKLL